MENVDQEIEPNPKKKEYAKVCWGIDDMRLALENANITTWTNKGCHAFLDGIEEEIAEAMCIAGWNVIHNNLDTCSLIKEFPCQDTQ